MKRIKELEDMTFWDITANEGGATQIVLGFAMILLGIVYVFIDIYYKIKYWRK